MCAMPGRLSSVLIEKVAEAAHRVVEVRLDRFGMTEAQYRLLALLYFCKIPLSQKEIASYLFRQQPGVSELLMRAQAAGYVERINVRSMEKVERFKLTPKGRQRLDQVWPDIVRDIRTLWLSCFSEEEIEQLQGMLKRVRDRILETLEEEGIVCRTP